MEPDRRQGVQKPVRRLNWTTIALIAGLLLLVLLIAYFATNRNSDQDKLTGQPALTGSGSTSSSDKACAAKSTYDLIKRELFRRAGQLRGSDQAAYDRLSSYAVVRMINVRAARRACLAGTQPKQRPSDCRAMHPGPWPSGWRPSAMPSVSTSPPIPWTRRDTSSRRTR